MNDLDKKILQQICDKNICPKSSSYFWCVSAIKAGIATFLIIFASIALGLELYIIRGMREEVTLGGPSESRLFTLASIATILVVALSIAFAVVLIRYMGRSYLYTVTSVAVLMGAITIIMAHAFDITGANRSIDRYVMGSYLEPLIFHEYDIWMQPGHGMLAGDIDRVISTSTYSIHDLDGNTWIINENNHQAATGSRIKIIGHQIDTDPITMEHVFVASETKMWR